MDYIDYVKNYWTIYRAVTDMLQSYGLIGTDMLISSCIERVKQDADADWNEDDVRIAIQNTLNEIIEKL